METSNRIVDVLFRAFGQAVPVPAQGQGTMNNLTFGNARFTYYETIGGGQGACPKRTGRRPFTSRCRTRSTRRSRRSSSRIRSASSATRSGSGRRPGPLWGGDGSSGRSCARALPALDPQRAAGPRPGGARGGEPGEPGRNLVNGERSGQGDALAGAGESVTIETPGGGGFGSASYPRERVAACVYPGQDGRSLHHQAGRRLRAPAAGPAGARWG